MQPKVMPVPVGRPSFINVPRCDSLDALQADVAIIAYPYTVPYTLEWSRQPSSWAPGAIREASLRYQSLLTHHDMDFGSELFAGRKVQIVDCGDVFETPGQYEANSRMATSVLKEIGLGSLVSSDPQPAMRSGASGCGRRSSTRSA